MCATVPSGALQCVCMYVCHHVCPVIAGGVSVPECSTLRGVCSVSVRHFSTSRERSRDCWCDLA